MLDWQDRREANVNLVLLCLWAAGQGRRLEPANCTQALAAVAGWHAASIEPLRGLRRRLKSDWSGLVADIEPTRSAVLAAELAAERAEQALMIDALAPWPGKVQPGGNPKGARANLLAYLDSAAAAEIDSFLALIG